MPLTREDKFNQTGEIFTKIGLLFKDAEKATDLNERIDNASVLFKQIAELEEETYNELIKTIE